MSFNFKVSYLTSFVLPIFLALPFIAQTFPRSGFIFFVFILPLIFLAYLYFDKDSCCKIFTSPIAILLVLSLSIFFYGIFLDPKIISIQIIKDLLRGFSFLILTIIFFNLIEKNGSKYIVDIIKIFRIIILFIATIGGLLGLVKYLMIKTGYTISVLYSTSGEYPWGSSLVLDYNFYSLTFLIAALISIQLWTTAVSQKMALIYSFIASLSISVGILSGSRRLLILTPILMAGIFLIFFLKNVEFFKKLNWRILFFTFFFVTASVVSALYYFDYGCSKGNLGCSDVVNVSQIEDRSRNIISDSNTLISPRIERWIFTFEIIKPFELFFGNGFSYREKFGCKFNDCKIDDYPHAPILSALLYGGVIGFLSTLACLIYALVTSYQILTRHSSHADLALGLIATTVFVSVSGDSLFSMPVFFSMLLISRCVVWLK